MEIHIARDGKQFGPYPLEEVQRQLSTGALLPTDYAWTEGAVGWVPLASFPGLTVTSPLRMAPPGGVPAFAGPPVAGYGVPFDRPATTAGTAIASMICGILSFLACPGLGALLAIILGHVARGEIRKSGGRVGGDGMAIAGLIMGYLGVLLVVVWFTAILAGFGALGFNQVQLKAKSTKAVANAKTIVTACHLYAVDHDGAFPKKLDELVPKYLPDRAALICPLAPDVADGYEYFGGTTNDPPRKVLIMSKFVDEHFKVNNVGRRIIAHVDGSCAFEFPPKDLATPVEK